MSYVKVGNKKRLAFALALIISACAAGDAGRAGAAGPLQQPTQAAAQTKVNGRIAFVSGRDRKGLSIYAMNEDGSGVTLLAGPVDFPNQPWRRTYYGDPAWSPDGKQLAFYSNRHGSSFDIYVMNADGSNVRRLTDNPADEFAPAWSPDGTRIAFGRGYCATIAVYPPPAPSPQCEENIYVMNADGSGQRQLTNGPEFDIDPAWSPDGTRIAFTRGVGDRSNVFVMNHDGSGLMNITAGRGGASPAWSPDGTRIAFASAGKPHCCGLRPHTEIYVVNPDGSNPTRLTTGPEYTNLNPSVQTRILQHTNTSPAWSPDGTKITFQRESLEYGIFPATGILDSDLGDVFVMNADGSNQRLLTPDTSEDEGYAAESPDLTPDWQPLLTSGNLIDNTQFFVRQHYLDFLNREPEPAGLQGWLNILNNCAAGSTACDRIEVSSAFFRSTEFQERGYFVYRFYSAVLGRVPRYGEFMPDLARVSGFQTGAEAEASRRAFIQDLMNRAEFKARYGDLQDARAYVEAVLMTAGVSVGNKEQLISALQRGEKTRDEVLRAIVESAEVYQRFYNEAFVVMQYFGYLRRDADILYLDWVKTMDAGGDYRTMIKGFLNSTEYRQRFGTP